MTRVVHEAHLTDPAQARVDEVEQRVLLVPAQTSIVPLSIGLPSTDRGSQDATRPPPPGSRRQWGKRRRAPFNDRGPSAVNASSSAVATRWRPDRQLSLRHTGGCTCFPDARPLAMLRATAVLRPAGEHRPRRARRGARWPLLGRQRRLAARRRSRRSRSTAAIARLTACSRSQDRGVARRAVNDLPRHPGAGGDRGRARSPLAQPADLLREVHRAASLRGHRLLLFDRSTRWSARGAPPARATSSPAAARCCSSSARSPTGR